MSSTIRTYLAFALVILVMGVWQATAQNPSGSNAPWLFVSSGPGQYVVPLTANFQLTVPPGTRCAQITLEGQGARRTSDGTDASSTHGLIILAGTAWQDCGPLAAYKFAPLISINATITAEYFR